MTVVAAESPRRAGAMRRYLCPARDQLFLLAPCMLDWLEPEHLAFFVLDVVDRVDTRRLHRRPGGCDGRPPYLPEMMCALVLYAYCCGIRSSPQIERCCGTDAAFRMICGGLSPDHATIARFIVEHQDGLEGLFVHGLRLCAAAGLVDLSVVALDGTKIAANASLARNRDAEWIRAQITQSMTVTASDLEAETELALWGTDDQSQVSASGRHRGCLERALEAVEAQDRAAAVAAVAAAHAAVDEATEGQQMTGRKPKDPQAGLIRAQIDLRVARERVDRMTAARATKRAQATAEGRELTGPPFMSHIKAAQTRVQRAEKALTDPQEQVSASTATRRVNITDPDSRIMPTQKGWVQGYNAQAIVNTHQIVLATQVSQDTGDVHLFAPMLSTLATTLTAAGISQGPDLILADAGYCSEHNLTLPGPDRLIATQKDHKQRQVARELGITQGPPPPGLNSQQEMEHLLRTPQGTAAYKQRGSSIEPFFGQTKHNRQASRFRRRGLAAARAEWALISLAHNVTKLHKHHSTPAG